MEARGFVITGGTLPGSFWLSASSLPAVSNTLDRAGEPKADLFITFWTAMLER